MIDTKAYRDCARTGREELIQKVQHLCEELELVREVVAASDNLIMEMKKLLEATKGIAQALNLPGWFCPGCGCFNGEAKEKREECRSCGALFKILVGKAASR